MKLWKKILIVVAIILCVGLLAGSIARTASSRVTSIKHASNASASQVASEPDRLVVLLPSDDMNVGVSLLKNGVALDPEDFPNRARAGDHTEHYFAFSPPCDDYTLSFYDPAENGEAKSGEGTKAGPPKIVLVFSYSDGTLEETGTFTRNDDPIEVSSDVRLIYVLNFD